MTGECNCLPGFGVRSLLIFQNIKKIKGELCEETCKAGFFGPGCLQKCDCLNENSCDPKSGKCACIGFTGPRCRNPCPRGTYGLEVNNFGKIYLRNVLSVPKNAIVILKQNVNGSMGPAFVPKVFEATIVRRKFAQRIDLDSDVSRLVHAMQTTRNCKRKNIKLLRILEIF